MDEKVVNENMESNYMKMGDIEVTVLDGQRGRRYMFVHRGLGVTVFKSADELDLMCMANGVDDLAGDGIDARVMELVADEMRGFRVVENRAHDGVPTIPGLVTDEAQVACLEKMRALYGF